MNNWQERHMRFDLHMNSARDLSRNALKSLIAFSASVIGFSVSLFSISSIRPTLNLTLVRLSWWLFLIVIMLSFFVLIAEGRVKLGKAWKGFQISNYRTRMNDYSRKEKLFAWIITLVTLFDPVNLLFNKNYLREEETKRKSFINGLVVHRLARVERLLFFFENAIFFIFVVALLLLVASF